MHYFDAKTGMLQEQDYSIYRDLRSWTAAITFRELNSQSSGRDFGVAVTFSLKAFPRFGLGQDTVSAAPWWDIEVQAHTTLRRVRPTVSTNVEVPGRRRGLRWRLRGGGLKICSISPELPMLKASFIA